MKKAYLSMLIAFALVLCQDGPVFAQSTVSKKADLMQLLSGPLQTGGPGGAEGRGNNFFVPSGTATSVPAAPQAQPAQPQVGPAVSEPQAQPAPPPQPPPAAQPQVAPQPVAPPPPPPPPSRGAPARQPAVKKGEVSFNFDDADIFSVIQTIFGDVLRVNYLVDPNVKGRVNFRSVAPIAKDDVLPLMEVILRLNGIGVVEEGGLYRIVPIADISREPAPVGIGRSPDDVKITGKALLQVVPIKFVTSSEVVRVLTPFLSKNAVMVDVPKSNYIIIVDTDANVKRLLQLVELFDSEQLRRIKPEVFVYPVQNGKAKDISSLLQQIFLGSKAPASASRAATPARTPGAQPGQPAPAATPAPGAAAPQSGGEGEPLVSEITRIFPDEITNSLIILATPDDYDLIAETIQKIDIAPRQVVIEAFVIRVDLTDNLSFGFAYSFNTSLNIQTNLFNKDISLTGDTSIQPGTSLTGSGSNFTWVGTDPKGIVRAKIVAALRDSKAKVLAAPHVLVSDNREARIQVGQQVPLATSSTTTPVGGTIPSNTTTSTIQYKDIGIILKVKPQVNDSGLVSLEVSQENSALGENVVIAGQAFSSITKTEATSNLVVQDGETIIIGGLIREDTTNSVEGIPFLSKIPLIGSLFSTTSKSTQRAELILLLTPHVLRNQKEASIATDEYIRRFRTLSRDRKIDQFMSDRVPGR